MNDAYEHVAPAIAAIRGMGAPPLRLVGHYLAASDPRANARRFAVEGGANPNGAGTQRLADALERVSVEDAQSARTLAATRARMPELDDEPGQCVLCGECPCSCESDPDLARDRELDMDERAAAD